MNEIESETFNDFELFLDCISSLTLSSPTQDIEKLLFLSRFPTSAEYLQLQELKEQFNLNITYYSPSGNCEMFKNGPYLFVSVLFEKN